MTSHITFNEFLKWCNKHQDESIFCIGARLEASAFLWCEAIENNSSELKDYKARTVLARVGFMAHLNGGLDVIQPDIEQHYHDNKENI